MSKRARVFDIKFVYFILFYSAISQTGRPSERRNRSLKKHTLLLSYMDLLKHFKHAGVSARRLQHELIFIRSVFRGRISSASLLQAFSISVPCRTAGQQTSTLLKVPFSRVNAMKNDLFVRLTSQLNRFLRASLPQICSVAGITHFEAR